MIVNKIAIIGGGASGLFCAGSLQQNIQVDLYEKNDRLGKKMLITGNGRCNVTNQKTPDNFLQSVVTNPKFLQSALHAFSPHHMIDLLQQNGVELVQEDNNRMFPKTGKAPAIINTLISRLKSNVTIKLNTAVQSVEYIKDKYVITANNQTATYDAVVIATGGKSYPGTGSTGDGYIFSKSLGHNLVLLRQSLCGLQTDVQIFKPCAGVSFEAKASIATPQNKVLCTETGSVLLTHTGVSGPAIHRLVGKYNLQDVLGQILQLDLLPNINENELQNQLNEFVLNHQKQPIFGFVEQFLVKRFAQTLLANFAPLLGTNCAELSKQKRHQIVAFLKQFTVQIYAFDGYEKAIVTRGGVDTKQVDPRTMQSKLHPRLFFLGEVLDVDALTGGYNLQIAFSTAFACATYLNKNLS